jgi:hypothetical protein
MTHWIYIKPTKLLCNIIFTGVVLFVSGICHSNANDGTSLFTHMEDYDDFISFGTDHFHEDVTASNPADFNKLLFVSAVAARGNDIFVADTGQRMIFRIDRAQKTLSFFAPLATEQTPGLYLTTSLSLYVVDRVQKQVIEYTRDGSAVTTFRDSFTLSSPVDVVESDRLDRILVADSVGARVVVFNRLGGMVNVIGQKINIPNPMVSVVAMATEKDLIYLLDKAAKEVQVINQEGEFLYDFGDSQLKQPAALAIDRCGRVFVADQFDNAIHVFQEKRHLYVHANKKPGLTGFQLITDLWVDETYLYVADGPAGRIRVFRIEESCQ